MHTESIFTQARELLASGDRAAATALYRHALNEPTLTASLKSEIEFNLCILDRTREFNYPLAKASPDGLRKNVGVVVPNKPESGLFRDAETIAWALSSALDLDYKVLFVDASLSAHAFFRETQATYRLRIYRQGEYAEQRCTFAEWLDGLDLLFVLEAFNRSLLKAALAAERLRKILYIPNLEWATTDPDSKDPRDWVQFIRSEKSILCIARSPSILQACQAQGLPAVLIEWSVPEAVASRAEQSTQVPGPLKILFNGGNLGYRDRRGLDIVIAALKQLEKIKTPIEVKIKCNKEHDAFAALSTCSGSSGLTIHYETEFIPDRAKLLDYYDWADVVLYPSRFEGLGLSLLEALHRGCYVLATDGYPMCELLPEDFLRIPATLEGRLRLANVYEPDARALAQLIERLAAEPALIVRDVAKQYRARQDVFVRNFHAFVSILLQH